MILQVSTSVRARILSLYQQGKDIQTIAEAVQVLPEAVETVVKAAAEKSRIVYVFADREEPATVIDVCNFTRKIKITNLTDDMISRAFGVTRTGKITKRFWKAGVCPEPVMVYGKN